MSQTPDPNEAGSISNQIDSRAGFEPRSRPKQEGIPKLAIKNRLPTISGTLRFADAGGLTSYAANSVDTYRRAAVYVDKILKGTKPADLPVEQPMKIEFVVNLKTAKQIGLEIPQWTLMKAGRVIK